MTVTQEPQLTKLRIHTIITQSNTLQKKPSVC